MGLTAEEAKAKGFPVSIGTFPLAYLGKAMAVNDTEGFVKVVRHRETGELLGVHMIGHNATECIAAAGALLHQKVSVQDVAETVFAHPTISEALKEAAEDALALGLHLPPRKVCGGAVASYRDESDDESGDTKSSWTRIETLRLATVRQAAASLSLTLSNTAWICMESSICHNVPPKPSLSKRIGCSQRTRRPSERIRGFARRG